MSDVMWQPIVVSAETVRAAGITPQMCCDWAIDAANDGHPERALLLLEAASNLIRVSS